MKLINISENNRLHPETYQPGNSVSNVRTYSPPKFGLRKKAAVYKIKISVTQAGRRAAEGSWGWETWKGWAYLDGNKFRREEKQLKWYWACICQVTLVINQKPQFPKKPPDITLVHPTSITLLQPQKKVETTHQSCASFLILHTHFPSLPLLPWTSQPPPQAHLPSTCTDHGRVTPSPDAHCACCLPGSCSSWVPSLGAEKTCFQLRLWSHTDAFSITLVFPLEV